MSDEQPNTGSETVTLLIMGASGDLTSRLLLPGLGSLLAVETERRVRVVGADRAESDVPHGVADRVRRMQRRAFELAGTISEPADLDDDPYKRAGQTNAPTLMIAGALDVDATRDAVQRWREASPDPVVETWGDVAHLLSMEQPGRFDARLTSWLVEQGR